MMAGAASPHHLPMPQAHDLESFYGQNPADSGESLPASREYLGNIGQSSKTFVSFAWADSEHIIYGG
jgi:hypothetical protein